MYSILAVASVIALAVFCIRDNYGRINTTDIATSATRSQPKITDFYSPKPIKTNNTDFELI
jgi:hypothetical protein